VTSTFREDTNTAASTKSLEDCLIDCRLIDMRGNLEFGALELWVLLGRITRELSITANILASSKLSQRVPVLERFLENQFLGSANLRDSSTV
jgi:hypothetical protein